jgi:V/A-type H+-transporting ATPase subunit I
VAGGEQAVAFFQLPGYRSLDPSAFIYFSFSLFFAIILADAGYALVLGGILGIYWRRLEATAKLKQLRNMMAAIVAASLAFGVLVGSYFGVTPGEGSLLGWLRVLDIQDFDSMMKLSIGIGVFHLIAANGMVLWNERDRVTAIGALGWCLVLSSGFGYWLSSISEPVNPGYLSFFFWGGSLGALAILCFSSNRPVRDAKSFLLRLLDGLQGIYGLSKAFGDVLSYMRLFALGLSSASLALTFNQIAVNVRDSFEGAGMVLFILILAFGHSLNFVLAIMSGTIHGLRLNLLEFYGWAIKGEGVPFKPFRKKEKSPWIK